MTDLIIKLHDEAKEAAQIALNETQNLSASLALPFNTLEDLMEMADGFTGDAPEDVAELTGDPALLPSNNSNVVIFVPHAGLLTKTGGDNDAMPFAKLISMRRAMRDKDINYVLVVGGDEGDFLFEMLGWDHLVEDD